MKITRLLLTFMGLMLAATGAVAADHCDPVKGRVTSQVVTDGSCTSTAPLPICTQGRFTGDLKGRFGFVASTISPFVLQDQEAAPDVVAATGIISIDTRYCKGTLVFKDAAVLAGNSVSGDGDVGFASLSTVDSEASTGKCHGATGRVRIQGLFNNGCVDCKYEGLICGVAGSHGDDDDDD